ncbi:hypothetical protein DSM106972_076730 [Dulcicalothrix desertica PCC 7102]|uniref:Uncharacterized protein n=1 Tax=Dulcicalothrix desertica PCC 7102 TaxID=232991 RepID=A0A3S1AGC1_9CYAN|nr:hypothetical protein [Dulcicalothrix desertica]RUT00225.1 hypothetical protein DSM106972_076730 [Dulcicalothrix desertica PCC 7102]TWH55693.1 hypothetical protein CAL7102_03853 [Dulcicalothrix desertica PCC 7102]
MTRFEVRSKLLKAGIKAKAVAVQHLGISEVGTTHNHSRLGVRKTTLRIATVALLSFATGQAASAAVIRIDESAFTADAGRITFSEFANGTINPIYTPSNYGGGINAPTVSFGGVFQGQTVGQPPIPAGAAPTGVVNGTPSASLALDPSSPRTFITGDSANPTSPVLSGS